MIYTRTNLEFSQNQNARIMKLLNKNVIGDQPQTKKVKAMGMSSCQGLCITYHLHSKAFC